MPAPRVLPLTPGDLGDLDAGPGGRGGRGAGVGAPRWTLPSRRSRAPAVAAWVGAGRRRRAALHGRGPAVVRAPSWHGWGRWGPADRAAVRQCHGHGSSRPSRGKGPQSADAPAALRLQCSGSWTSHTRPSPLPYAPRRLRPPSAAIGETARPRPDNAGKPPLDAALEANTLLGRDSAERA